MAGSTVQQRKKQVPPVEEETLLLDVQEQEEFIATLKQDLTAQATRNKFLFMTTASLVTCIYLFFAVYQARHPWTLQHNAPFRDTMAASSVVVAELGAAATVAATAIAVITYSPHIEAWKSILTCTITVALFIFGFWTTAIASAVTQGALPAAALWQVCWRPLLPGLFVAGATVAIDSLDKNNPELSALIAARYNLKKA